MKLEIKPAIMPIVRQAMAKAIEAALENDGEFVGYIDGGDTMLDGSVSAIYIYPVEGKTEADVRRALTGHADEPPWPMPEIAEPEEFPTEIP